MSESLIAVSPRGEKSACVTAGRAALPREFFRSRYMGAEVLGGLSISGSLVARVPKLRNHRAGDGGVNREYARGLPCSLGIARAQYDAESKSRSRRANQPIAPERGELREGLPDQLF